MHTDKSTTFYIFRHGETEAKKANPPLVCGSFDSPLTEDGKKQITEKIGPVIKNIVFDKVCVSPLFRSQQSYEAAYVGHTGAKPIIEIIPDLCEIDYGEFDGKPTTEFDEAKKAWKDAGHELNFDTKIGGSESNTEAADRFEKALLTLARENPSKTLLLPSHNGIMRALFFLQKISGPHDVVKVGTDIPFGTLLILHSDGTKLEFSDLKN